MTAVDSGIVRPALGLYQYRNRSKRPQLDELLAALDEDAIERQLQLVERDQHLLAVGSERVLVEDERHSGGGYDAPRAHPGSEGSDRSVRAMCGTTARRADYASLNARPYMISP